MLFHWQALLLLLADETQTSNGGAPLFHWENLVRQVVTTIVFIIIGLFFFCLTDWLVERVMPRSLRKGIEEDKNVALAIVIAAVILGIALILAAAIHG